ncbi:Rrf2 family transcriptional regulator%2C group III [Enterobacter hormaechei]|nr:Rrf2 family transcriptional regulator%2C group III [Enterobacter hormaechei]
MLDYRFPTALQMVLSVAMAEQSGERSTSAILAYGLEANPSFIRKLMVPLARDGIIVSTLGRNGSIHLGRPAEEITLRDIYLSVTEDKKLWASRPDVPARCVVSANACWYFKSIADEAEQASLAVLARHTVASALEEVKKADTPAGAIRCRNSAHSIKKRPNPDGLRKKSRLHCEGGFLLSATSYAGNTSLSALPRVTNLRSVT